MELPPTIVYRRSCIPAIYAELPFVRKWSPCLLADCNEDLHLLNDIKAVASGRQCLSSLESPLTILVKCEFPGNILNRRGTTGDVIEWCRYGWKTYDVQCLLQPDVLPGEAMSLEKAEIDGDLLARLAERASCIEILDKSEEFLEDCGMKGYEFPRQDKERIRAIEKPLFAALDLQRLKNRSHHSRKGLRRGKSKNSTSLPLRQRILQRDHYRCILCGRGAIDVPLDVNHIIPRSLIKKLHLAPSMITDEQNLCVTCFDCNHGESDYLAPELIDKYINAFAGESHANHGVLKYVFAVRDLQLVDRGTDADGKTSRGS